MVACINICHAACRAASVVSAGRTLCRKIIGVTLVLMPEKLKNNDGYSFLLQFASWLKKFFHGAITINNVYNIGHLCYTAETPNYLSE